MKKIQLIILALLAVSPLFAQKDLFALQPVKETPTDRNIPVTAANNEQFIFKVYGTIDKPKGEIDAHFLGDEIASKWAIVNELYLRKGEVSVGFSTSYTETVKPSVFNAVCRINNYYKKAVNKGVIEKEKAQEEFLQILDCAVAAYQYDETEDFESALKKVKEAEQMIQLFKAVKIVKI